MDKGTAHKCQSKHECGVNCNNKYQRQMHVCDIKKTVFDNIMAANPNYILFDFVEIFSPVKVYKIGERKISYTHHEYMKSFMANHEEREKKWELER